ncbi:hypothetical protein A2331_03295 [Candidatus Falkowbacteria bacterium RIFOXYB2_FULL_34_18]|uniref:Uncharacterized protein n=1 Tax=Candidatus Falkowbacteria bacterium RIFOXYD2_FULL_34_120 TaxID=1798007 RepID=A0A1F5TMN2_9BACT|nr:MAG: hypothetical protein A2500_02470 [Candidatus Falkowbacteria bacterium RIFOXYC12_FULL_34_55]OGF28601.1 MAG: hypothetical protein A2331_03295 [Candidatus Falkowbacteria bacterium RIFOXYB2_FULL_34_18]OGF38042.1 MAG: hypothetical protein A2466_07010 [Candidatus Falkowbacteria bacterium RIFOXYC2_FULL_34_220]OGF38291.1 MAG: hypothetical protein A2515_05045 [Candidatus Falkowbacteria bacterium RIFOXYD12_FULL_34_57]OGF40203.1 MAG: hypothetical protein A2531_01240 [Candidatus Falkowbacteria bact
MFDDKKFGIAFWAIIAVFCMFQYKCWDFFYSQVKIKHYTIVCKGKIEKEPIEGRLSPYEALVGYDEKIRNAKAKIWRDGDNARTQIFNQDGIKVFDIEEELSDYDINEEINELTKSGKIALGPTKEIVHRTVFLLGTREIFYRDGKLNKDGAAKAAYEYYENLKTSMPADITFEYEVSVVAKYKGQVKNITKRFRDMNQTIPEEDIEKLMSGFDAKPTYNVKRIDPRIKTHFEILGEKFTIDKDVPQDEEESYIEDFKVKLFEDDGWYITNRTRKTEMNVTAWIASAGCIPLGFFIVFAIVSSYFLKNEEKEKINENTSSKKLLAMDFFGRLDNQVRWAILLFLVFFGVWAVPSILDWASKAGIEVIQESRGIIIAVVIAAAILAAFWLALSYRQTKRRDDQSFAVQMAQIGYAPEGFTHTLQIGHDGIDNKTMFLPKPKEEKPELITETTGKDEYDENAVDADFETVDEGVEIKKTENEQREEK